MDDGSDMPLADRDDLTAIADRLSSLADTAELMGDGAGAVRLREAASKMRLHAMRLLDS